MGPVPPAAAPPLPAPDPMGPRGPVPGPPLPRRCRRWGERRRRRRRRPRSPDRDGDGDGDGGPRRSSDEEEDEYGPQSPGAVMEENIRDLMRETYFVFKGCME